MLTDYEYVNHLLNYRLKHGNCFSYFREHINLLKKSKEKYNNEKTNKNEKDVKIYEILHEKDDIKDNAREIAILTRQAIELYKSSQITSIYAKPILLYYSYTKLERVLFLSAYKSVEPTGAHGLFFNANNKSIVCQKDGAFPRFHDSYNWNPSIYLNDCVFRWDDLVLNAPTNLTALTLNMKYGNNITLNEMKSGKTCQEHELTREIVFTYAMSMLARYYVKEWNELIEGKDRGKDPSVSIIWKIQEYLRSTQSLFPNLIYNQLHGIQYYFYTSHLDLFDISEVKPQTLDWAL